MTDIGMNLAGVNFWSTEDPFIDRFKLHSGWVAHGTSAAVPLDANGNPTGVPAGADYVETIVPNDQSENAVNTYVLTYSGTGTVSVGVGTNVLSSTAGQIVFTASANVFYTMIANDSATNPVHDIHVVRQDQQTLYNAGEMFTPEFLAKTSNWSAVRTMDWQNINNSQLSSWADRPTLNSSTWETQLPSEYGVPIEVMVKLANEAHVNLWMNIPTLADDNYVRNAVQYVKDHLDPSLKLQLEYSNEVWNPGFQQWTYAQNQANALWATDSNHNGTIDPSEAVSGGSGIFYGYRSAQIASIAHQVYGSDASTRLVDVLAGQQGYSSGPGQLALQGIARANVGSVSDLFGVYATTTYFGNQFSGGSAHDQATILGWATSGAAGLTAAFHELQYGGTLDYDASLTAALSWYASDHAFAQANGLQLVAYEGGADLEYRLFPSDQQATIRAFFEAMMNDPRMGAIYTKMITDYAASGGAQANVFSDTGTATAFGYWGILDSIHDDSSPRYDALLALSQANHTNIVTAPISNVGVTLTGTGQDDMLVGGSGNDSIVGLSSTTDAHGAFIENDYYLGGAGADTIIGGLGNDHIYGNLLASAAGSADGDDSLFGGAGNDYIQGNAGNDTIDGGTGNDRLYGGADNDSIMGGAGSDYLQGNRGNDTLDGGADNDTIRGGADNDSLMGGAGNDMLFGDVGNDVLVGGTGHDTMTGGAGMDTFSFAAGDSTFSLTGLGAFIGDEITDFTHGTDKIALGFSVASLLSTAPSSPFSTVAAAEAYAQQLLNGHAGAGEVAAVAVGSDTYLFFNGSGADGASIDSSIKLDGVAPTGVTLSDFI